MITSLLFFVANQVNVGQNNPAPASSAPLKNAFIRVSTDNGKILVNQTPYFTTIDEQGNVFKTTKAFSIEYGWQMLGGKEWHQTCKYPHVGIGGQYLHVMKRKELGHPFSVYGFYDGNYFWSKNFQLTNRMATGFTYGFTTYNPNDPLPNDVISTKLNAFIELGLGAAMRLSDFLVVEPGFRFAHFSNGNIRKPQRGINIASFSIGLKSTLSRPPVAPINMPLSECLHRHEVLAYLGMAPRQIEFDAESPHKTYGMNFLMANLHLGYNYEVSRRIKLGGGVDFIYDGTNGQRETARAEMPNRGDVAFRDKTGLSVFIGGESSIGQLSVVATLGYMAEQTRFEYSTPAFEQRLGFKYHFYRNVFAGANVRAYRFRAAKAVEFHIGARKFIS